MIQNLMTDSGATDVEIWLSGPVNFRYSVYPEYKANRRGKPRPRYEQEVKKFLEEYFQAKHSDGVEADDMMGIRSQEVPHSILIHLDKDLDQLPGKHFNWELRREGLVVREKNLYEVSLEEGNRFFWYQLVRGDSTDNIKGIAGMGPKRTNDFLDNTDPKDWYQAILDMYGNEEEMDMNARCVYIWRKPEDNWRNILAKTN